MAMACLNCTSHKLKCTPLAEWADERKKQKAAILAAQQAQKAAERAAEKATKKAADAASGKAPETSKSKRPNMVGEYHVHHFHLFPNIADALQMLWNRCLQKWTSFTSIRSRKSQNFGRKLRSAMRPLTTFGSTCATRVRQFPGSHTCPPEHFLHYAILCPPPFRTLLPRRFPLQATSPQLRLAFLSSAP